MHNRNNQTPPKDIQVRQENKIGGENNNTFQFGAALLSNDALRRLQSEIFKPTPCFQWVHHPRKSKYYRFMLDQLEDGC